MSDDKLNFSETTNYHVDFVCNEGEKIKQQVAKVVETGERRNLPVNITAYCKEEPVAEFVLNLSLKLKS